MSNPRVAIELYVDDNGSLKIKQFAGEADANFKKVEDAGVGAAGRIQAGWDKLKGAWLEILGGIAAVREAWDLMNSASKAEQEKRSFESLAASYGASGSQIIASLKEVSRGTVDTMTMVRSAGTAMMMGIKPDETIQLMNIAMATAKQTGQTTVQAFADISLAVGRQSRMILDNLGIIVSEEKAYDAYAHQLGKTAGALSETEKKAAFMNATLTAGKDLMARMGNQTDTQAEKFQRLSASVENIKVAVGSGLIKTFNFLEGTFQSVAAASLAVSGGIFKIIQGAAGLTDKLGMTSSAAAEWKINAEAAFGAADELARKADQSFKDMRSSNDEIIKGQKSYTKALNESTAAQEALETSRKEIIAQQKKEAADIAAAQEEMYDETGQLADQHYAAEAQKLVAKAARWKQANGNIVDIENWLYDQLGALEDEAAAKGEQTSAAAMDRMQSSYRTLMDQLQATTQGGLDQLDEYGLKIQGMDGKEFTVHANLDGSGFSSTVDTLIAKMRELAAVSSPTAPVPSGGQASSWDGGMYDSYQVAADSQTGKSGMSAAGKSTTININQKMSRSDVVSILSEQKRLEGRK